MSSKLARRAKDKKRDSFSKSSVIVTMKLMYKPTTSASSEHVISRHLGPTRAHQLHKNSDPALRDTAIGETQVSRTPGFRRTGEEVVANSTVGRKEGDPQLCRELQNA